MEKKHNGVIGNAGMSFPFESALNAGGYELESP